MLSDKVSKRVCLKVESDPRGVSSTEFADLETLCKAVVKEKQPFERLEISKETLLKMFKVKKQKTPRNNNLIYF